MAAAAAAEEVTERSVMAEVVEPPLPEVVEPLGGLGGGLGGGGSG